MIPKFHTTGIGDARPTSSERKERIRVRHQAYVADVLRKTGLTQKALAEAADFDRTTLSRLFSDRYDNTLSPIILDKLAAFSGLRAPNGDVDAPVFAEPAGDRSPRAVRPNLPEARPFAANDDVDLARVIAAIVAGRDTCVPFRIETDGLEATGLLRGDIAFVDRNAVPVRGDIVSVQLYNWDHSYAGHVFRVFDPPRLVLPWSGLATPPPIELSSNLAVMGPVTQVFRPTRAAQALTPQHV